MKYLRNGKEVSHSAFHALLKMDMADEIDQIDPRDWNEALDLLSEGMVVHAGSEGGPMNTYEITKEEHDDQTE